LQIKQVLEICAQPHRFVHNKRKRPGCNAPYISFSNPEVREAPRYAEKNAAKLASQPLNLLSIPEGRVWHALV